MRTYVLVCMVLSFIRMNLSLLTNEYPDTTQCKVEKGFKTLITVISSIETMQLLLKLHQKLGFALGAINSLALIIGLINQIYSFDLSPHDTCQIILNFIAFIAIILVLALIDFNLQTQHSESVTKLARLEKAAKDDGEKSEMIEALQVAVLVVREGKVLF